MTTPAHDLARSRLMLTPSDVDLIQDAVRRLEHVKDLHVYDLGAGSGTTAAAVLSVRREHVHGTTLDIDQTNLDWSRTFITQTWPVDSVAPETIPVPGYLAFWPDNVQWRWLLSNSIPSWKVKNRYVHLLLIDTSHDYEPTIGELTHWWPKMSPDGLVWLDDYTTYPGVKQAVDEFVKEGVFEIIYYAEQSVLGRFI